MIKDVWLLLISKTDKIGGHISIINIIFFVSNANKISEAKGIYEYAIHMKNSMILV